MPKKKTANTWAASKASMADWSKPGLLALIHDLYKLSEENRRKFGYGLSDELTAFVDKWN